MPLSVVSTIDDPQFLDDQRFRRWYADLVRRRGAMGMPLNPNPDDSQHQYDYRKLFHSGWAPPQNWERPEGGGGHFPSRHKGDDHPRAIVNGVDTKSGLKVAPDWYTGPHANAPRISQPLSVVSTEDAVPKPVAAQSKFTPEQQAVAQRYGINLREVGARPGAPTPLPEAVDRMVRGAFKTVSQPFAEGPEQLDPIAATSRGWLHGAASPLSTKEYAPRLQKPGALEGARLLKSPGLWAASKVEDVSDLLGQFMGFGLRGTLGAMHVAAEAVPFVRRLAPWMGRLVEQGGAGFMYRVAQTIAEDPQKFANMDRREAARQLAIQGGLGAAQWAGLGAGLEAFTGIVQAGLKNKTFFPAVSNIMRAIDQHGRDAQVEAELRHTAPDPAAQRAAMARFWDRLSQPMRNNLTRRYPEAAPTSPSLPIPGSRLTPQPSGAIPPMTPPSRFQRFPVSPGGPLQYPLRPTPPASTPPPGPTTQSLAVPRPTVPGGFTPMPAARPAEPAPALAAPQKGVVVPGGTTPLPPGVLAPRPPQPPVQPFERPLLPPPGVRDAAGAIRTPAPPGSLPTGELTVVQPLGVQPTKGAPPTTTLPVEKAQPKKGLLKKLGEERGAIGLWMYAGRGKEPTPEMAAKLEATAPEVEKAHSLAVIQRDSFLQDVRDAMKVIPGAAHPEVEGVAVKSPDAIRDKMAARGEPVNDALRSTVVIKQPSDLTAVTAGLEKAGYQIIETRQEGKGATLYLKKGPFDPLVKELRVMTPAVYGATRELGVHLNDIDKAAKTLVDEHGDSPAVRQIVSALRSQYEGVYDRALALDSAPNAAADISARTVSGLSGSPTASKPLVTLAQELVRSLRDMASTMDSESASSLIVLADRLESFATGHSPSDPIVPPVEAADTTEFIPSRAVAAGGMPPRMPPGTPIGTGEIPPMPPEGQGPRPPEPGGPTPGGPQSIADIARQVGQVKGPSLAPSAPHLQLPPGTDLAPAQPAQRVRYGFDQLKAAFGRIMTHGVWPWRWWPEWIAPATRAGLNPQTARIVRDAYGQRPLDSIMSDRHWEDTMRPEGRRLARALDIPDEEWRTLSTSRKEEIAGMARSIRVDAESDPSGAQAWLPEAIRMAKASNVPILKDFALAVRVAFHLSPEELGHLKEINNWDALRGRLRQEAGVQEGFQDWHVNHIWDLEKSNPKAPAPAGASSRLKTRSAFSGARELKTLIEGVAKGYVPRTLDIYTINQIADADTAHVIMSKRIVDNLSEAGIGVWAEKPGEVLGADTGDMVDLGRVNPVFRKGAASMWIPKDSWPIVRPFAEAPAKPPLGDLQALQFGIKTFELAFSIFHDLHLIGHYFYTHPLDAFNREGGGYLQGIPAMTRAAAQGLYQFATTGSVEGAPGIVEQWGPVRRGLDLLVNPTDTMEMMVRGGLTGSSHQAMDAYRELLHPEKRSIFDKVNAVHNKALWDRLWRGLKAYDAVQTGQWALRDLMEKTNPRTGAAYTAQEIIDDVAALLNKKYGGLNWDLMGTGQMTRQAMRAMMFAPDWLWSNLAFVGEGLQGLADLKAGRDTVASKIAVKQLLTLGVTWMTLVQGFNFMMNGRLTFQNEPGHEMQLEIPRRGRRGQRQYLDVFTPAAFLTLGHLLQGGTQGFRVGEGLGEQNILTRSGSALKGILGRTKSLAANRLAFIPRVAAQTAGGATAFGGRPIQGATLGETVAQRAGNIPFQALPFTAQAALRGSPAGQYMPGGKISPEEVASQLIGAGAPSAGATAPITTFNSLSRRNRIEFMRDLPEDERMEFLRQKAMGEFTGAVAQKVRAAWLRQDALRRTDAAREEQLLEDGQIREAIQHMVGRGMKYNAIRQRILPFVMRQMSERDQRLEEATP